MFFQQVTLEDDQGWILTNPQTKQLTANSDVVSNNINFFSDSDYGQPGISSLLYSINIYSKKNYDNFTRSYMKFQELAAIVGGFMKIVLFAGEYFRFYLTIT